MKTKHFEVKYSVIQFKEETTYSFVECGRNKITVILKTDSYEAAFEWIEKQLKKISMADDVEIKQVFLEYIDLTNEGDK